MQRPTKRIIVTSVLSMAITGCAWAPGKPEGSINPMCALVGAVVGGGGAAAASIAAGPIGLGVLVGAMTGSILCADKSPMAEQKMTTAPPPAKAAPMAEVDGDKDGDGVVDRLDRCPDTPPGVKVNANGCPDILLTLTGVNFKFDSAQISPASEQLLDQAVDTLTKASLVDVRIEGHTDSTGPDDYNLKLSERRAMAVQAYLLQHGIAASRLTTEGKGESEPTASNDTAAGRYQNRRVEFHVVGGDTPTSSNTMPSDNSLSEKSGKAVQH